MAFSGLDDSDPVDDFGDLSGGVRASNGLVKEDAGTNGDSGYGTPCLEHKYSGYCCVNYLFRIESSTSFDLTPRTSGPTG
jgi:hypothetical protein